MVKVRVRFRPAKIHKDTEKTCKFFTVSTWVGMEPATFSL